MKADFVRRVPLFSSLTEQEVQSLEHIFIERRYKKNQVIFLEEETGEYMYIVISGKVKVTKSSTSGKESILAIHQAGDFFGEMSLLDGKTSPATVSAMEECRIVTVGKQDFNKLLLRNEKVVHQIIRVLCGRLRQVWAQVQILSYSSAEARILAGIHHLSTRHGIPDARGVLINLKITHQELAEMVGTSRETVTRTLGYLQKKGMIRIESKRIILRDPKALLSAIREGA